MLESARGCVQESEFTEVQDDQEPVGGWVTRLTRNASVKRLCPGGSQAESGVMSK